MTEKEIGSLLTLTVANFPQMQNKNMKDTLALWNSMLADIPFSVAKKALLKVLSSAKFFPTVAEIREAATMLVRPMVPTHSEAWGLVRKAIMEYSSYREKEALESLNAVHPAIGKTAQDMGWRELCLSEEPDIIRAQFRKAYEVHCQREKEMAVLPAQIRGLIESSAKHLELPPATRQGVVIFSGQPASQEVALYHLQEMKKVLLEAYGGSGAENMEKGTIRVSAEYETLLEELREAEESGNHEQMNELLQKIQAMRKDDIA